MNHDAQLALSGKERALLKGARKLLWCRGVRPVEPYWTDAVKWGRRQRNCFAHELAYRYLLGVQEGWWAEHYAGRANATKR